MVLNIGAIDFLYLKKECTRTAAVASKENNLQRTKLKSANPSFPSPVNKLLSSSAHSWDKTKESKHLLNVLIESTYKCYIQVDLTEDSFRSFPDKWSRC